jgi:hypothetical protein
LERMATLPPAGLMIREKHCRMGAWTSVTKAGEEPTSRCRIQ